MSIEATKQVPDYALDQLGVSAVTSTRTAAHPRDGSIYNRDTLAAAPPVWFHRLQDGRYLALFKNRWHSATTPDTWEDGPQIYDDYEVDDHPCYMFINPTTGAADGPYPLPGLDSLDSAVSRGEYLFTLGSYEAVPTVQHWVITRAGGLQLQGSEPTPLSYRLGLWCDGFNLRVFGVHADGGLASVRKNWGRVGDNSDPNMPWQYQNTKGWLNTPDEHEPLTPTLPTGGPVSLGSKADRLYLVTTELESGAFWAKVWTTRPVDSSWKPLPGDPIHLGTIDDYLGGTVYLQPQLPPRNGGMLYLTSVKVATENGNAIITEWGTLAV